jgi:hypothetical protein
MFTPVDPVVLMAVICAERTPAPAVVATKSSTVSVPIVVEEFINDKAIADAPALVLVIVVLAAVVGVAPIPTSPVLITRTRSVPPVENDTLLTDGK